jgi:hypothetical protein
VQRFRWSTSAEQIAELAARHLAEPSRSRTSDPVDLDSVLGQLRS